MTWRDSLLQKLSDLGVDEGLVAENVANVIRGRTVKKKYKVNRNTGEMELVQIDELITPRDAMQGAMVFDALHGGQLGLAPRELKRVVTASSEIIHRRLTVDTRIIANQQTNEFEKLTKVLDIDVDEELILELSDED